MEKKFIDKNKKSFIFLIALFIVFSLLSFFIITNYFAKLEKNINDASISNLIHKIQSKIEYNHKIALEYSSSNELYEFIEKNNQDYLYKNFKERSYTLEDLDLSYFILKDLSKDFRNIEFIVSPKINLEKIYPNKNQEVFLKTKVKSKKINNLNISEISFYDYNSNILFSVKVEKEINLVNEIKNNILIIFLCLILLSIFSLLYISSKYKNTVIEKEESIDGIIADKTSEMKLQIQELEKTNKDLYEIAHTDYLTQTMNRRNFFIHAQSNFSDAKKNNELLCVVMIDIDNFKNFNDKYGHSIGDKVLVLFANSIKNNITEKTILGRIGGEEFALIIKNTNLEDAIKKAEKLKKKIEEIELEVDGKILNITASFGVSDNQNCSNIDEMLQRADNLLYTAKESGRNLVRSRLNFC